jgi:hypothetical protein
VETIGVLVDCGAALVSGLILGYRWTLGAPWHLIAGLIVGEIFAITYFAVAIWAGRHWPGMLEARLVGMSFMALVILAGLCGVLGAWFGYRKSAGRTLF